MAGYGYINNFRETELHHDNPISSDHICRPVIIDSKGRKHPIIRYTNGVIPMPTETIVTKTETYVDHVHPPIMYPYKQQQWQIHPTTIHQNHRPQLVQEEYITSYKTEANRAPYWRPTGYKSDYNNNGGNTGYYKQYQGDEYEQNLTKPTSDISKAMNLLISEAAPALKTSLRFGVPPPVRREYGTTTVTETISSSEAKKRYGNNGSASPFIAAGDFQNYNGTIDSKEAMRSEAAPALKTSLRFGVPPPVRREYGTTTVTETISSSEAKKRYGNNGSASPFIAAGDFQNYNGTIDSKEAMRRYYGATV